VKAKHTFFVSVGSTDFDDLIRAVDLHATSLNLKGIMQIGNGKYKPKNFPFFRFADSLQPFYKNASFAVAHGGLATTMEILREGVPLVSVSNPDRYDNHQEDLLKIMEKKGYLIWCRQIEKIGESINLVMTRNLNTYNPPECKIHIHIDQFLKK